MNRSGATTSSGGIMASSGKLYLLRRHRLPPVGAPVTLLVVAPNAATARATAHTEACRDVYNRVSGHETTDWIMAGLSSCQGIGYAFRSYAPGSIVHVAVRAV